MIKCLLRIEFVFIKLAIYNTFVSVCGYNIITILKGTRPHSLQLDYNGDWIWKNYILGKFVYN